MTNRREALSYIATGTLFGGIIGYYTGAQELLGIQSEEVVRVPDREQPTETPSDPPTETPPPVTETPSPPPTETPSQPDVSATAYYTFEGTGERLIDRSENNHNGQLNNAQRISGSTGKGLAFDRDRATYATLGSPSELTPGSGSFTISLRFQTTNTIGAGNQNKQRLLAIRDGSNERVVITIKGEEPRVTASLSEGGYSPDAVGADSNAMHADGEWHHIVLQRDMADRQIRLYVDGNQVDRAEVTQVTINPGAPVYLGAQPEYPNPRYYTGKIDEVGIFRQALTPSEL